MWACKREGRFQDYPAEVTAIIEAAYAARAGDADRGRVEFDVRGRGGKTHFIDLVFGRMEKAKIKKKDKNCAPFFQRYFTIFIFIFKNSES